MVMDLASDPMETEAKKQIQTGQTSFFLSQHSSQKLPEALIQRLPVSRCAASSP